MKTALIRILTIATLATSMSAFAATNESKSDDAATPSAAQQQDGCPENSGHGKKQKKAKPSQSDDQKEKELDRLLMGMYG
jgi:hypothetical protein